MKTSKRIMRGVQLLDETVPGWEHKIKLDKLDLSSTCGCVCGQIVTKQGRFRSRYEHGLSLLGVTNRGSAQYGFQTWGNEEYSSLTDEWTRVIRAKRNGLEVTT